MAESSISTKLFAAVFAALIVLHLALVLGSRLYPCIDLPNHLAAATVARHIGEPGNEFARYYRVETGFRPNTAHLLFCGLPVFPNVEAANRALFAVYVVLLPLSMLLIIRKLGGSPWYALLSFPLLYNHNVEWGFVGFALAVPLVLLFYRFFAIDAKALKSSRIAALAALCLIGIYFFHVLAALFALFVLLCAAIFSAKRSWRMVPRLFLAAVPLLAMTIVWWRTESRMYAGSDTARFLASYYSRDFIPMFTERRLLFIFDNSYLYDGAAGYAVALVFSLGIVAAAAVPLLAALRMKRKTARGAPLAGAALSEKSQNHRGGASGAAGSGAMQRFSGALPLLLAGLLCCLLLPKALPRQAVLYERFPVFLFLGLVAAGAALSGRRIPHFAAAAFTALAILHATLWSDYFIAFNRENRGFDGAFLRGASERQTLAGLMYDYRFRGRPLYIHFPCYYTVWEKGVATGKFADYRFGAVRRIAGAGDLPWYLEWVGRTGVYDGRYAGMDLLLTRGVAPMEALQGFEHVRDSGKWSLFRRISSDR